MPTFAHIPVMLEQVLSGLQVRSGGRWLDGTVGGAGHAEAILEATSPTGWLYGSDRDAAAIRAAEERLQRFAGRFELRRGNFTEVGDWIPAGSCDGALLDLGVSSHQLDTAERGFSFQQDGPLDMRMDDRQSLTASELVNTASEQELARLFFELGDEPQSRRIAREIVRHRQSQSFATTAQLAGLIEKISPRHGRKAHPATRVFQALRIQVNDELGSLEMGLETVWKRLHSGGRLAVITFHSLEDRFVKRWSREKARDYTVPGEVDVPELRQPRKPEAKLVSRKAILPGDEELKRNPRSRSAQLRVVEKT